MICIRPMTAPDVPLGLHLGHQAGWNQLEADWWRFLDLQPDGCFVAEWQGAAVGTTTTCIFGPVAWVAMVLVEQSLRGRGIGRALMEHALTFLDARGVASIRLDATPLGQPLYERLGFAEQFRLARYEGVLGPTQETDGVTATPTDRWPVVAAFDHEATRTERQRLLAHLFEEQPGEVRSVWQGQALAGYLTIRRGARATQIGPCIAAPDVGPLLLADAFCRHAGERVYLDIPLPNHAARQFAEAHGLTVQRHLTRMCRGVPFVERLDRLWTSFGPELG